MRRWIKHMATNDPSLAGREVVSPVDSAIDVKADLTSDGFLGNSRKNPISRAIQDFVRAHAAPGDRIVSIGGGNGEHEAALIADGWRIMVTDVQPHPLEVLRAKLPDAETAVLDILQPPGPQWAGQFDVVLVPSLLYWLTDDQAETALANIASLLRPGGLLLLCFRSRDTVLNRLVIDALLPAETALRCWLARPKLHRYRWFAGYRRTLAEVRHLVSAVNRFDLVDTRFAGKDIELGRSALLSRSRLNKLGCLMGGYAAYLNMFAYVRRVDAV